MKKIKPAIAIVLIACTLSSCATVFGGHVNAYQRTRPVTGQASRQIRPVALIADILFFTPGLIIDFATCAIYKPQPYNEPAPAAPAPAAGTSSSAN